MALVGEQEGSGEVFGAPGCGFGMGFAGVWWRRARCVALTHHKTTYVGLPGSPVDRLHELERMRRSIAMLQPGAKALSREDAMRLISELEDVERRMRDLRRALRAVLDDSAN